MPWKFFQLFDAFLSDTFWAHWHRKKNMNINIKGVSFRCTIKEKFVTCKVPTSKAILEFISEFLYLKEYILLVNCDKFKIY